MPITQCNRQTQSRHQRVLFKKTVQAQRRRGIDDGIVWRELGDDSGSWCCCYPGGLWCNCPDCNGATVIKCFFNVGAIGVTAFFRPCHSLGCLMAIRHARHGFACVDCWHRQTSGQSHALTAQKQYQPHSQQACEEGGTLAGAACHGFTVTETAVGINAIASYLVPIRFTLDDDRNRLLPWSLAPGSAGCCIHRCSCWPFNCRSGRQIMTNISINRLQQFQSEGLGSQSQQQEGRYGNQGAAGKGCRL